jgi:hypothetical protein
MLHKHHIVPLHAGGSDDPSNIETITIEEHADRHKKLWETFGRRQDKDAWQALSGIITRKDIILEALRRSGKITGDKTSREHLRNIAALGGKAKKGILHTTEAKERMSKVKMGSQNPFFGRKHTEETKWKMSQRNKKRNKKCAHGSMDGNYPT